MKDRNESVREREGEGREREEGSKQTKTGGEREKSFISSNPSHGCQVSIYGIPYPIKQPHYHTTPGAPAPSPPTLVNKATEG